MPRLSFVGWIAINDLSSSSTLHIGDNVTTTLKTRVFAVQREVPIYYGNEGNFESSVFNRPFPQPQPGEPVEMIVNNWGSCIKVNAIRVLGISSSAVLQVGSNTNIEAEARVKNIRQFVKPKPGPQQKTTFVKLGTDIGLGEWQNVTEAQG
ncbi:spore germination protein GerPE [Paenibacillus hexagrammi]|uniref:Spore germination protein GerPE n=1 Tax=Paenibacillus hexagrammi TaxID=2908839 RepID=A0ABY3SFU3_9BACL|nr:spore germination protein GerPE [Paenibacillus sp. YPD9-1]UJF32894.1 spore germination protein GerPE [Paenibacillus sp. YPD9-1]